MPPGSLTRRASVVAAKLLTDELQSLSVLWQQARGQATWSTFRKALAQMVAEGQAEQWQVAPGKSLFFRRSQVSPAELSLSDRNAVEVSL